MPADTTIPVSDEVWERLMRMKQRGDSFDDVLRRELGLDDEPAEQIDNGVSTDGVDALLANWTPDTDANARRARDQTQQAVAWLREQDGPRTRSEIVAAVNDSGVSDRSWWERAVQPGLRWLAEQGVVEYRSGYHDYAVEKE